MKPQGYQFWRVASSNKTSRITLQSTCIAWCQNLPRHRDLKFLSRFIYRNLYIFPQSSCPKPKCLWLPNLALYLSNRPIHLSTKTHQIIVPWLKLVQGSQVLHV